MESGPSRPVEKYKISKKQNMFPADDSGTALLLCLVMAGVEGRYHD